MLATSSVALVVGSVAAMLARRVAGALDDGEL
jgi:hypothetical protein